MPVTNSGRPQPGGPATAGERQVRRRPDPNPLRLLIGFAGVASAAAVTSAMLPSVAGSATTATGAPADGLTVAVAPEPTPRLVTRYVTLKPGQTAPPDSTVVVRPQPTPQVTVRVITRTRQSGKP